MAIRKTIKSYNGLMAKNAYHRVENIRLTRNILEFQAQSYERDPNQKSAQEINSYAEFMQRERIQQLKPFEYRNYSCPYNHEDGNPFRQAYEHLKTLPEFSGGEDV